MKDPRTQQDDDGPLFFIARNIIDTHRRETSQEVFDQAMMKALKDLPEDTKPEQLFELVMGQFDGKDDLLHLVKARHVAELMLALGSQGDGFWSESPLMNLRFLDVHLCSTAGGVSGPCDPHRSPPRY